VEEPSGPEEGSSEPLEHYPEPVRVEKVTRGGSPAPARSGNGGRGRPQVRIGGTGGRRDPALEGLSDRDRVRLESYMATEPDQTGRGRVRRVGFPDDEGAA
jgi:hypothetical protein